MMKRMILALSKMLPNNYFKYLWYSEKHFFSILAWQRELATICEDREQLQCCSN